MPGNENAENLQNDDLEQMLHAVFMRQKNILQNHLDNNKALVELTVPNPVEEPIGETLEQPVTPKPIDIPKSRVLPSAKAPVPSLVKIIKPASPVLRAYRHEAINHRPPAQQKTSRKWLGQIIFAGAMIMPIQTGDPVPWPEARQYEATADSLRVRTGPGMAYRISGNIRQGSCLTITSISGDWAKLSSPPPGAEMREYYVSTNHIAPVKNPQPSCLMRYVARM